jgi:hypothetical protein
LAEGIKRTVFCHGHSAITRSLGDSTAKQTMGGRALRGTTAGLRFQ